MPNNADNPDKTLANLRIIWAVLLLSQVVLLIVFTVVLTPGSSGPIDPKVMGTLHLASLGFMVLALPAGLMLRNQTYKKNWVGNTVTPAGYMTGNMLLMALCEGVSMFALVVMHLGGKPLPYIIPSAVALATLVVNWPTGRPMRVHEPDLLKR